MVGRKNAHDCVRINLVQDLSGKRDTRCSIALGWLGKDLLRWHLGQLLADLRLQKFIRNDPHVLCRNDAVKAIEGLLNERALSKKPKYLLGGSLSASRPESRPTPASQ